MFKNESKFLAIALSAIFFAPAISKASTESELFKKSLKGDYQAQRNLAYSYQSGWGSPSDKDYIKPDPIQACAWRKVILLTNPNKSDLTDYANESNECKKVQATDNVKVWSDVRKILAKHSK